MRLTLFVGLIAAIIFLLLVLVQLILVILLLQIKKVRLSRFFKIALLEVGIHIRCMVILLSTPCALYFDIAIGIRTINRLQIIQQEVVPLQAICLLGPLILLGVPRNSSDSWTACSDKQLLVGVLSLSLV